MMIARRPFLRFLPQVSRAFTSSTNPETAGVKSQNVTHDRNKGGVDQKQKGGNQASSQKASGSKGTDSKSDQTGGVRNLSVDMIKKTRYLEFAVTSDLYRIDVGFVLARPPIIDDVTDAEMKRRIALHKFKKHNNLYPKLDESLFEFTIKDPLEDIKTKDPTYRATHEKREKDGTVHEYHEFSKDIKHLDLQQTDPKHIMCYPKQTVYLMVKDNSGQWIFPNKNLEHEMHMTLSMQDLRNKVLGNEVSTGPIDNFPSFCHYEKISEKEIAENKLLQKTKGRKVFYFRLMFNTGSFASTLLQNYSDYQWVPKAHLSQYVDRDNYNRMIKCFVH